MRTTSVPTTSPTRPSSSTIGIVLAGHPAKVRQGLREVLELQDDLRLVGEAGSPAEVVARVEQGRPDVVLLEASAAGSLATCAALTSRFPGLGVLMLSSLPDDRLVLAAIQHGARGYVVQDADTTELVRAIRAVGRGDSALDARSTAAMVRSLSPGPDPHRPRLTEREVEVLRLLAQGCSNRMIGGRLYISETTVKFHVSNLMRKLTVSRRAEAVYAASKLGYI
ncbi:response regulator transcription factor [Kineosporia rhizophila]|uniref:LuxR C-terminal-related transcriptional regulator n=1 Tax=Kineosporia TaxID=49184 RepID=UPI001E359984|nr:MULTISPECIES: response regulator transcription factor [Kineosporia]MCE0534160.1 response regulator transcription factor [Kineosporia rhizophila]